MTTITFTPPARLLNANDRGHWAPRAKATKLWRQAAYYAVFQHVPYMVRKHGPSKVTVTLPVTGRRRRDPANYAPTLKSVIDGITDAGIWPDDNANWVTVNEPVLNPDTKLVTVTIEPRP